MELVIASRNLHKVRELREMLKTLTWLDVLSLSDFSDYQPPEENGETFEEIAKEKARHAAEALQRLVLADDSGLSVPILNDQPGIYSSRYAGKEATDEENRLKLLEALKGEKDLARSAYFTCSLVLATPDGEIKCATGRCEGTITEEEHGRHGFGYDPIFKKHDYGETFAELSEEIKNQISHRTKAVEKMRIILETLKKRV